jgi:DNA-binding GntR family transcriptional regulator
MTILKNSRTTEKNKNMVSRILVRYARGEITKCHHLTQQLIAEMIGVDKEVVKKTLFSLNDEGLIRLEHSCIVVKNKLLQTVAES